MPTPITSNASGLMSRLDAEALLRARNMISSRFSAAVDLDESSIATNTQQLRKQLELASSQLGVCVQGKLEALKRAADLMDESSSRLQQLSAGLRDIDARVAATNTAIARFEHLRRAHHARDNLSKVTSPPSSPASSSSSSSSSSPSSQHHHHHHNQHHHQHHHQQRIIITIIIINIIIIGILRIIISIIIISIISISIVIIISVSFRTLR